MHTTVVNEGFSEVFYSSRWMCKDLFIILVLGRGSDQLRSRGSSSIREDTCFDVPVSFVYVGPTIRSSDTTSRFLQDTIILTLSWRWWHRHITAVSHSEHSGVSLMKNRVCHTSSNLSHSTDGYFCSWRTFILVPLAEVSVLLCFGTLAFWRWWITVFVMFLIFITLERLLYVCLFVISTSWQLHTWARLTLIVHLTSSSTLIDSDVENVSVFCATEVCKFLLKKVCCPRAEKHLIQLHLHTWCHWPSCYINQVKAQTCSNIYTL